MRIVLAVLAAAILTLGVFVATLWLLSPIDPVAWQPPLAEDAPSGYPVRGDLANAELIAAGRLNGPEDVHPARADELDRWRLYAGQANGDIVRIGTDPSDPEIETLINTDGHPLGLAMDQQGRLVIADAVRGLLRLDIDARELEVLAAPGGEAGLGLVDDVDIAADGVIYFSDASNRYGLDDLKIEILEARPYGRLFAFDPSAQESKRLTLLADGFYFANGVAVAADQQSVLVNETFRYRVKRVWINGSRAGETEVFADNLPGFPDGISTARDGGYWLALYAPRNADLDAMHPRPFMKALIAGLPPGLQPEAARYGGILALDEAGSVALKLEDPGAKQLWEITSVEEERSGGLLLGTLHGDRIGYLPPTNK